MSTLKVDAIRHNSATSDAITTASDGTCTAKLTSVGGAPFSHRNKVINGAMKVSQRASSKAMGNTENAYVCVDRFKIHNVHDGAVTASQSSTSPDGFGKSLKFDVTTADTNLTTSQRLHIIHYIEAQDLQDLGYGTSGAKEARVSFYVRSNKTGNYTFALNQADNGYKNISIQYTINSANTWERKSFVIPGDTAGVINDDNGTGIELYWWLAAGPTYTSGSLRSDWTAYSNGDFAAGQGVNLLDSTSNEFYLTGVQFEVGDTVTTFEHRSFGEELSRCQRYCQVYVNPRLRGVLGSGGAGDFNRMGMTLLNTLRTDPSATWSGTQSVYGGSGTASITGIASLYVDPYSFEIDGTASGTLSGGGGTAVVAYTGGNEATLTLSAEL